MFHQIKQATTPFDFSQIYNAKGKGDTILRSFEGGRLAVEEEYGKVFPPNGPTASCPTNVKPTETRCPENCKLLSLISPSDEYKGRPVFAFAMLRKLFFFNQ